MTCNLNGKCNHMCGCMAVVSTKFDMPLRSDFCTCEFNKLYKVNPKFVLQFPEEQLEFDF